jgi:catechol-2,3-dioxygenase
LDLPGSQLVFRPSEKEAYYHFAFNIPENQINQALQFVKRFASPLLDTETGETIIDFVNWNARAIYFLDPAGNIVEFIARHDLPNASNRRFSGNSLLEISEIGLPVGEVGRAFEELHEKLMIDRYSGNFERFCAAGDEHGLLILTETDRNWYPTEIPSRPFDLSVEVETPEKKGRVDFREGKIRVS